LPEICHDGRTMREELTEEEIDRIRLVKAGEFILIPHYYYVDDEHGNVIYDTDLMKEEFKKELDALIENINLN